MKQILSCFILLTSMILGLQSCQKDSENNPVPPPSSAKLKQVKEGDELIAFTYNPDGTVKKVTVKSDFNTGGDLVDYTVTYNTEKKIGILESTTGDKIIPVYENNIIKRADIFTGPQKTGYTNYNYENGQLKRATIYLGSGVDFEPYLEYNFSYSAAGNISETVVMMTDGVPGHMVRAGHIIYEYDQKTNPLHAHKELLDLFWLSSSKNNITREDHFDSQLQLEDRYQYTYIYKTNGLPEKAEVKVGLPGQPVETHNIDYSYQ